VSRFRRCLRMFVVFALAVYGPVGPTLILFVLVAPPLILLSGWPAWLQACLFGIDVVLVVGTAIWLGPSALAEVRAELEAERRR
jgi:hypothetical protein